MEQQGYIIEKVDDKTAKLKMQRHSACASCGKCTTTSETKDIVVEVDNTIGAQVGDRVKVNMESVNVLKATFIAYLIPLAGLLIGTIATYYLLGAMSITSNIEIISGGVGIVMMLASYLILKKNNEKFRASRQFIPIVTEVISRQGNEITL